MEKVQHERIQHEESATWKKCIMKKVPHSATCKKPNMKKVLHEKVHHGKSATWKKRNMKKVLHEKSAT